MYRSCWFFAVFASYIASILKDMTGKLIFHIKYHSRICLSYQQNQSIPIVLFSYPKTLYWHDISLVGKAPQDIRIWSFLPRRAPWGKRRNIFQNVQKLLILAVFTSCIASIVKELLSALRSLYGSCFHWTLDKAAPWSWEWLTLTRDGATQQLLS